MPPEQVILGLASIVVTAVSGLILAIFRAFFDAIRKGELISRSVADRMVALVIDENEQLRDTNKVLRTEYVAVVEDNRRLTALLIDRSK